ncbi:GtrA family protein [Curvibacter sp. APW13]|uniref:GtrA family protein n=1 Tax=Curvibacter sp. APW13 TaxID=3077236 RepID=UPI0028E07D91|nr:GtrA family protein [Curvibacter sp. APW13]MDT8991557.1 GtrA family protein [Curvibacter sp. APW13]
MLKRAVKFGLTGVLATATHVVVASLCIERAGLHPALANAIAFLVATAASLYINTYWSFESALSVVVAQRYVVVATVGLLVSAGLSNLLHVAGYGYGWGIAAVVAVMPVVNFLCHHFWTYRESV